ncbi:MAG: SUMF1/EgtB/PvdO family nonheme iron enzyme [Deltaproteobacteria bacterium]|nr:SUMF1/EgtB/PvdO family nonheme iron enzyme [Deltaproteobacteria bacterium]
MKQRQALAIVLAVGTLAAVVLADIRTQPEHSPGATQRIESSPAPRVLVSRGRASAELVALGTPFRLSSTSTSPAAIDELSRILGSLQSGADIIAERRSWRGRRERALVHAFAVELAGRTGLSLDGVELAPTWVSLRALESGSKLEDLWLEAGDDVHVVGRDCKSAFRLVVEHPLWRGRVLDVVHIRHGTVSRARGSSLERPILAIVVTSEAERAHALAHGIVTMSSELGFELAEENSLALFLVGENGEIRRSAAWRRLAESDCARTPPSTSEVEDVEPSTVSTVVAPREGPRRAEGRSSRSPSDMIEVRGLVGSKRVRFRLDRTEVSNREYAAFSSATASDPHRHCHPDEPAGKDHTPRYFREFRAPAFLASPARKLAPFDEATFRNLDHPVVGLDFWDVYAFARWAGKRLPTPEEWRVAACGDGRPWPFGGVWDPSRVNAGEEMNGENDGFTYTAPVRSFQSGASPQGLLHMAGNVAEWTLDPESGTYSALGGSFASNATGVSCLSARAVEPGFRSFDLGFRCAADFEGDD